jgi:osmotically-inducible protein OsmY
MIPNRIIGKASFAAIVVGALLSLPQATFAAPRSGAGAVAMEDESPAASAVTAKLNKKQYQNVKVSVENGVVTLSGTVDLYEYKADADKKAHKVKGITAVRNEIQVAGPQISDQQLKDKLVEKLQYDRVGYGQIWQAISLDVHDGDVILGGHARTDVDKDSALALVSTYPGVKDVTDDIQVDPVSFMDDQIRVKVARAVYSSPMLSQYAIDPAKPIRISVQNGNVELYGVVRTQAEKDTAYIQANAVPGVFSVKNYLQVANQPDEKPKSN